MKQKKTALFQSVIALILCISMLMGTTFAWFTDSVTTGINTIAAGVLDVELYHSNAAVADERVDTNTKLFMDLNGNPILWEPGVVSYENLRITNAGDLALAYQLALNTDNENFVVEESGAQYGLSQILKVGFVEGGITATDRAGVVASVEEGNWTTLASFVRSGALLPEGEGESEKTWGVVIYWEPGENDNYWNLNNGKQLNEGEVLMIDLGVKLIATQEGYESDSFGADYDSEAKLAVFPVFVAPGSTTTTVVPNDQNQVASGLEMTAGQVSASIPAGVQLAAGATELTMSVSEMDQSDANISLGVNEAMRSLDVHIEGVDNENNTVPMTITLKEIAPVGLNMGNYKLYHVENGQTNEMTLVEEFTAHNQFKYDPATGDIVLNMATFSEVAVVANAVNPWQGKFDYSWYKAEAASYTIANADQLAGFGAIVGGMDGQTQDSFSGNTVKLISDVNLGGASNVDENGKRIIFYPIGYYNSNKNYEKVSGGSVTSGFMEFKGIFDGNGHTISNFYQNTWEMFGDYNDGYSGTPNHFRDGMGLFGKVYGGTVKNLTVANFSSDGEYTTTGVIAAYADSSVDKSATFENIAIVGCNPRVYNIGNGGIVGCGGWYSKDIPTSKPITFKNITVDKTNKISALWGSWDVACGGIMGQYYPNSGCGVTFENCNMAAQIDVYNDVCANYQYYAYRYAGMMIGSIRNNLPADANGHVYPDMSRITAKNCTVNFGDWNDYYYCELVANSLASYTHDHQMSRLEQVKSVDVENKTVTSLKGETTAIPTSGRYNYVVVKEKDDNGSWIHGDGKDYATCYHFVNGVQHKHDAADTDNPNPTEMVDGKEMLKEDKQLVYREFEQLFTGYGWGVTSKGLEDFEGIDIIDIDVSDQNESVTKFATKFTGDFLYRVGNDNEVAVGNLFDVVKDDVGNAKYDINDSGVWITVETYEEDGVASGTFTANTSDWTQGMIKFSGIGLVKITIQDYDYCKPTELIVEVVEAKNYPSPTAGASLAATGNNVVLVANISNSDGFSVSGAYGLYGNGFTITLNPNSHSTKKGAGYAGYIHMNGGTLDNVRIEGPVFAESNIYQTQALHNGTTSEDPADYFRNAINIDSGNAVISNSYISGARTAICVKSGGDVKIENSRISGGAYANIEVLSSTSLTLKNVVTEQKEATDSYGKNKNVIGTAIVLNNADTKLILDGLTQYNWLTQTQWDNMLGMYKSQFPALFSTTYAKLQHTNNGTTYVNTGIIWACDVTTPDVEGQIVGYDYTGISVGEKNGVVYTLTKGSGESGDLADDEIAAPDYESSIQNAVPPTATFDYNDTRNNEPEQSDSNDYCYYDSASKKFMISFDEGESKNWYYDILTITKAESTLDYSVSVTDGAIIDTENKTITFSDAGEYVVTYKYEDTVNYKQSDGKLVVYSKEYTKTVAVTVFEVADTSAKTEFAFRENAYRAETVNGDTYVMPDVNATVNSNTAGIGVTTIGGVNVYYPIVSMHKSGTSSWYNYFSVFEAVTITDLNGTVYSTATTEMPSGLTVVGGFILDDSGNVSTAEPANGTGIFNYSTGKTINNTTYSTYGLCYYPDSQFTKSTNSRDEQTIVAKYRYTDSNGKTFYYYIGYWCEKHTKSNTCVTPDTLVTLADGTQKRIDHVTYADELLVWNFYTGEYDVAPASIVMNHGYDEYTVVTLKFDDGTVVNTINGHGFFDATENEYIILSESNVADYVGHEFIQVDGDGYKTVKLVDYAIKTEYTESWSVLTAAHFNCILENMFTLTPAEVEGSPDYLMPFELDEGMKYDEVKMQADIEKYGLYTYEDFADYCTYEQFVGFGFANWKVAVGKGYITWDDIVYLLSIHIG